MSRLAIMMAGATAVLSAASTAAALPDDVTFKTGLRGGLGWAGGEAPSPASFGSGATTVSVPTSNGLTGQLGAVVGVRFHQRWGFELGASWARERVAGQAIVNGTQGELSLSESALRLPLVAEWLVTDLELSTLVYLSPVLQAGVEYLAPWSARAEHPSGAVSASTDPRWLASFGLGTELAIVVPIVDLRVPILLRGAWDPGVPDGAADLAARALDGVSYDLRPRFRLDFVTGIAAHF